MKRMLLSAASLVAVCVLASPANALTLIATQVVGKPLAGQYLHFGATTAVGVPLVGVGKSYLTFADHNIGAIIADGFFNGFSSTPATQTGNLISQGGFAGTIQEDYYGKSPSIVDGVLLTHAPGSAYLGGGAVVLSANFLNGVVTVDKSTLNGTFTASLSQLSTPFPTWLSPNGLYTANFHIYSVGGSKGMRIDPVGFIHSFSSLGSGQFFAVPEAPAWALMLIGVGGLGAALRRRRAEALAA